MAVIRVEKRKGYTIMSNYHLRDKNLSLKAKGLLSIMLSCLTSGTTMFGDLLRSAKKASPVFPVRSGN